MLILTIRTDKPEAEIGLFEDGNKLAYSTWQAHRDLAEALEQKIDKLLEGSNKVRKDLEGVVVFQGPGSFTGLRIGITIANALSYVYQIPIVATRDDLWIDEGVKLIRKGSNELVTIPFYGAEPNITKPTK